jgi:beta-fructofuranosidase
MQQNTASHRRCWRLLPLLLLLASALLLPSRARADARAPPTASDGASPRRGARSDDDDAYARLHPAYHIAPERRWMNDPNGVFVHRGIYHVFYQVNPGGAAWGGIAWGHVASSDLARWVRLPLALRPGPEPYDADGAFSGSVTLVDGAPRLLYTCVSQRAARGYYFQQQCSARPANASDPWLREWRKDGANPLPLAPPPGGTHAQWRDPATAWRDDGGASAPGAPPHAPPLWHVLIGAQVACRGAAALYTSPDFAAWTYAGLFYAQPTSAAAPAPLCSQFGDAPGGGVAWEMPSAFPLGAAGSWVFLYGDQVSVRAPFQRNAYLIGRVERANNNNSSGASSSSSSFVPYGETPLVLDGGEVYAAQTALEPATGRRLLFGWAQETPPSAARGWQGALTLPRVLGLTRDGRALTQAPAPELRALRAPAAHVHAAFGMPLRGAGAATQLPLPPSASRGTQREIRIDASSCAASSSLCTLGMLLTTTPNGAAGPRTNVTLTLDRAAGTGTLLVDRTHTRAGGVDVGSGGPYDARPQRATFALPPGAAAPLALHVFVDHSILEAYAADGLAVTTARIYPAAAAARRGTAADGNAAAGSNASDWGVAVFGSADARADVRVWELSAAWV